MLTYQLHTRIFQIEGGKEFSFPNKVLLELKFAPSTAFGTDNSPSRTLIKAHAAQVTINANTGRWLAQSDPPLQPLEVVFESPTSQLKLHGDLLRYEFECSNLEELEGTLRGFKWIFPCLLNLEFPDPPIVEHVRGQVGETGFRWEHKPEEWRIQLRTVTSERLEQNVIDSFLSFPLFVGIRNRRLAAALHYFHVAVRLNVCGDSPWEFMAESILNYCKALEILFVTSENSREDIRYQLERLNFSKEEIEGDFIPLLILRSWVDVAHPRVAIFEAGDLKILYRYLAQAEERMRDAIRRVIVMVRDGAYQIPQDDDLSLNAEEPKGMKRLMDTMLSRLPDSLTKT